MEGHEEGKDQQQPGLSNVEVDGEVHEFVAGDKRHPQSKKVHAYLSALWAEMKAAGYIPKTEAVIHEMTDEAKDDHLCHHSEKLANAFALLNTTEGSPITITKNLRVCLDCNEATKFIAKLKQRPIHVRDANSWHHFDTKGNCSCKDYW